MVQPIKEKQHSYLNSFIKKLKLWIFFNHCTKIEETKEMESDSEKERWAGKNIIISPESTTSYAMNSQNYKCLYLNFDKFTNKLKGSNWNSLGKLVAASCPRMPQNM